MAMDWDPTVIAAERASPELFTATLKVKEALVPLALCPPLAKVTQAALLVALHDEQGGTLRFTVPVPAGPAPVPAANVKLAGETDSVQEAGACWLTVNVPTDIAPLPGHPASKLKVPTRAAPALAPTV
jgi:hypothetical protein